MVCGVASILMILPIMHSAELAVFVMAMAAVDRALRDIQTGLSDEG